MSIFEEKSFIKLIDVEREIIDNSLKGGNRKKKKVMWFGKFLVNIFFWRRIFFGNYCFVIDFGKKFFF